MELHFNTTLGYALGLSGLLLALALRPFFLGVAQLLFPPIFTMIWKLRPFMRLARETSDWVTKHLIYRSFFRSRSGVHTYSRLHTIFFASSLAANLSCIFFQVQSWSEACSRAGTLALVNTLLLYVGPCFGFIAGILRLPLRIYQQVHATAGYMVGILASFHAVGTVIIKGGFAVNNIHNLLAVLAMCGICLLLMPISLFSRILPYEFLLFVHRTMSLLLGFAIWCHLPVEGLFPRLYLYIAAGVFSLAMVVQMGIILYRSRCRFHTADLSWSSKPIIQVLVRLQRRLKVEPGQYVNLWVPSSLLSTLQIHPFAVASWSPDAAETLVIFAEIRKGFTNSLRNQVRFGDSQSFAMFTGPHGSRLPVDKYDHVLLIATDLGIVALLPYLQWLTHAHHAHQLEEGPNRFKSCRSIHLLWYLCDWEIFVAVSYFLNVALAEDELRATNPCEICGTEHRPIIKLTVYGEKSATGQDEGHGAANAKKLANSVRGDIHWEPMDIPSILDEELSSILNDEAATGATRDGSRKPCAVAASVSRKFEDQLTNAAREKLRHVDLMFTDYQP